MARKDGAANPVEQILAAVETLRAYPGHVGARTCLKRFAGPDWERLAPWLQRLCDAGASEQAAAVIDMLDHAATPEPRRIEWAVRCLLAAERAEEALDRAQAGIDTLGATPGLRAARAMALRDLGRADEAHDDLAEMSDLLPDDPAIRLYLGFCKADLGDVAGACELYRGIVDQMPAYTTAWAAWTRIGEFKGEDTAYAALRRAAAMPNLPASKRENFDYAVANAAHQRGDVDIAWRHLQRANCLRRASVTLRADNRPAFVDAMIAAMDRYVPGEPVAFSGPRAVFVAGMPRSGTTLVERILGAHPRAEGVGELDALGLALVQPKPDGSGWHLRPGDAVAQAYRGEIARLAPDAEVAVDKQPLNFRFAGYALAAMPEARLVHLKRDPVAVCFSNLRIRFQRGSVPFSYDMAELGAMSRACDRAMDAWAAAFPDRVLTVDYEALTTEPETQVRRLLQFCGLDWDPGCLEFHKRRGVVRTASVAQVRRPIYTGSSEAWRPYAHHLGPLFAALGLDPPAAATSDAA